MSTCADGRHFSGPSTQVWEAAGPTLPCHAQTGPWVSLCLTALCTLFSLLEMHSQHGAMAPRPRFHPAPHLPSCLAMRSGTNSLRHPGSPCRVQALPLTDAATCSVHLAGPHSPVKTQPHVPLLGSHPDHLYPASRCSAGLGFVLTPAPGFTALGYN